MNARQLEIFHAVMRCKTITDAAHVLNISQPAVSKAIRLAEAQLGIKLFRRIKGRLYPTLEAESLFPEADRLFRDLAALQRHAGDLRTGMAGLLRVAASSSLGISVMPSAVAAFRRKRPGVKIVSHLLPAEEITELILSNQVDLGMTLSPVHAPTAQIQSIGTTEMICLMPEGHPLAALDPVRPRDLGRYPLISFPSATHFGRLLDDVFETDGVKRNVEIEVAMSLSAGTLVQRGAGIAIVDGFFRGAGLPGLAWRRFRPRVMLPVNLIASQSRPPSRFAGEFVPFLQGAVDQAAGVPAREDEATAGGILR